MKFIKSLLPVAALALSSLATAGTTELNSVVVKYGDLNLDSAAGIARLHKRISNAAQSVCSELDSRVLDLRGSYDKCVDAAVNDGVAAVDNANLTQFHASKAKYSVVASNR